MKMTWFIMHWRTVIPIHKSFLDFDFVALPYAIRKKDIQHVRDVLGPTGAHIQILAKVDTVETLHNFEEIIRSADGIVLNRVELSLELPAEKLMLA